MAFNGRFVLNIIDFASRRGADLEGLIKLTGKTVAHLSKDSCTLTNDVYNKLIQEAVVQTGDKMLGLHAGEHLNLSASGLVGQITQSCETVKQALEMICEFANLGCSSLPMQLEKIKTKYSLTIYPNQEWLMQSEQAVRQTAAGTLAFTIKAFHSLTRMQHFPKGMDLMWSEPDNSSEFQRVFNCPIRYEQKVIRIYLDESFVSESIITANYDLLRVLVQHAEAKSILLKEHVEFSALVKQAILNMLKPEIPSMEQIAGHLNLSVRTLQRRLKKEGISFKKVLDDLRKELALTYIRRSDTSISDVAYLLDYSDVSTFNRSFKRWVGSSPSDYRRKVIK